MTNPFPRTFVLQTFVLQTFVLAVALLAAAWFALPGPALAQAAPPQSPPEQLPANQVAAVSVRVESAGRETKLVFSLTACADFQAYVLDSPARAIVDLPEVNFLIDPAQDAAKPAARPAHHRRAHRQARPPGPAQSEIKPALSYRFGRLSQGKSRIIVDLSEPAAFSVSCAARSGAGELTLQIAPTDPAAFRAAARAGAGKQAQADSIAAPLPAPSAASGQKPLIVLDPGHGGVDNGTAGRARDGQTTLEKNVVLDFAKAMAATLRAGGRYRVAFTREDDTFVPLQERVRIAQRLGASLFVSLHADSLRGGTEEVQGATIYTVSERASDAEAARVAEKENKADALAGQEAQEQAGEVNDILFDLTRRETRSYSNIFAKYLRERWKTAARLNKNPRRFAGFVVLKAPDVPSVLLELGYLSNAADADELTSPKWREKAAAEAARAVDDFFSQRMAAPNTPARP
jgi:N-acetylmuramoyl-L-alanine amidase